MPGGWVASCTRAAGWISARPSGWRNSTLNLPACEDDCRMTDLKGIQVVVERPAPFATGARSGEKYTTAQGFTAIRDGQKPRGDADAPQPATGKPRWLKALPAGGERYARTRRNVHAHQLATVCEEAK